MEWIQPHDFDNGAKLMEHSYLTNNFVETVEFLLLDDGEDYADPEAKEGETLYESSQDKNKLGMLIEAIPPNYHYLVNWDRQEFVDKTRCKPINGNWNVNNMRVHPLPLLTAEGNGRGGGDYHGDNKELVGTWARDRISVMKEPPIGFTEIIPNFTED